MSKLIIPAVLAGALFLPTSAGAAAIALSSLASGQVTVVFSNPPSGDPDVDISFMTEADGSVGVGEFASAIGEASGAFEFTNNVAGTILEIIMDLTRVFNLETGIVGDLASGATSISLAILSETGVFLPTISLSDPTCDPNAMFSVADGDDFSSSCSTTATFTFAALDLGDFTLAFASSSSVDLVGGVPLPGAAGLFGLGVLGLALFGVTTRPRRSRRPPSLI